MGEASGSGRWSVSMAWKCRESERLAPRAMLHPRQGNLSLLKETVI